MAAWDERIFRWRNLWFTLVPGVLWSLALNSIPAVPWGLAHLRAAGGGAIPDLQLRRYDGAEAYALIAALGEPGRAVYRDLLLVIDTVYPPFYGAGLAIAIGCLCRGRWRRLAVLPLLAALADLGENACALAMLAAFPAHAPAAEALAGWCTAAKWGLIAASLALIVACAALRPGRR